MSITDRPGEPSPDDDDQDTEDKILDGRIEQTLVGWFTPPSLPPTATAELKKHFDEIQGSQNRPYNREPLLAASHLGRRTFAILAGLAASILLVWMGTQLMQESYRPVVFRRQPLTVVYKDLVARGFEPYYLCDDPKRFQETMQHRHGQSLALNERGNRLMLGLSYTGGWTSETTAILFQHQGQPIVIFVDNQPYPKDEPEVEGNINVRFKELDRIFMVELSPLKETLLDVVELAPTER